MDRHVMVSEDYTVLAECETLLQRTLDLIDGNGMSRLIAARLSHMIEDLAAERVRGAPIVEGPRPPA